jgi:hypothetical protein
MEVFNDSKEIIMTPTLCVMFLLCLLRGAAESGLRNLLKKITFRLV